MAGPLLQTLQKVGFDDITFRCKSLANFGTILTYAAPNFNASGVDIDAGYVEKISGSPDVVLTKVAGVLMSNVTSRGVPSNTVILGEDTGTSNEPRNFNANETPQSGVCRLLKLGVIETDQVDAASGVTFGQGSGVYIGDDGKFTTVPTTVSGVGSAELVGHALSDKRSDGFVRVFVNIR